MFSKVDASDVPMFNKEKSITDMLRIPVCEDCIRGLYDENEVLLYCIQCNHSQWVWKPTSKINYNTNVVWLDSCPKCLKEDEDG